MILVSRNQRGQSLALDVVSDNQRRGFWVPTTEHNAGTAAR